jgi:hypothetical protein
VWIRWSGCVICDRTALDRGRRNSSFIGSVTTVQESSPLTISSPSSNTLYVKRCCANPFIKRDYESCHEELAKDPVYDRGAVLWEMRRNLAEAAFAIGVFFGAMVHGASEQEIDRLERGLIHATASLHWQVKKE